MSLMLVNGSEGDIDFRLPESPAKWERVLDSASLRAVPVTVQAPDVKVCANAVVLLLAGVDAEGNGNGSAAQI